MIKHHPDDNTLIEYSAGAIDWALGLSVAAHLHYCRACRLRVSALGHVGGSLLRSAPRENTCETLFMKTLEKIRQHEENEVESAAETEQAAVAADIPESDLQRASEQRDHIGLRHPKRPADMMLVDLPNVVAKMIPKDHKLKWKNFSPALKMARLSAGQDKYEVAFHRISSGGKVAEHDHRGIEVTVVLKGSFSDGNGVYCEGDYMVKAPGEVHRPTAAQHQDCLCFTVSEAPVALTGLIGKVLNPFLSVKPS